MHTPVLNIAKHANKYATSGITSKGSAGNSKRGQSAVGFAKLGAQSSATFEPFAQYPVMVVIDQLRVLKQRFSFGSPAWACKYLSIRSQRGFCQKRCEKRIYLLASPVSATIPLGSIRAQHRRRAITGTAIPLESSMDLPKRANRYWRLEDHVPHDHLLRRINWLLDFDAIRQELATLYSHTGRPSIDPELMLRMLLIGYLYGIRSERRLVEEVHLNLAYRWFCKLGLEGRVPDRSTSSKNHHRRVPGSCSAA